MKVLIGITSCLKYTDRVKAQLSTWIPYIHGADWRVFVGGADKQFNAAWEIHLPVPDDYGSLHLKSRAIIQYAYDNDYTHLFKVDDDAYILPDRLLASNFAEHDYIGAWIVGEGTTPNSAIRYHGQRFVPGGCGIWLSRRAMKILLDSKVESLSATETTLEDHWVGWTLGRAGITPICDHRYINFSCFADQQKYKTLKEYTAPEDIFPPVDRVISMCEYTPQEMLTLHEQWQAGTASLPVRVVVPRPQEFMVSGIRFNLPKSTH